MIFESRSDSAVNRYEVTPEELVHSRILSGQAAPATVSRHPWAEAAAITRHRDGVAIVFKKGWLRKQKIPVVLEHGQTQRFFDEAIGAWAAIDRGAALKAAFDYSEEKRSQGWVWIAGSIFFPGLLAALLLSDGIHNLRCNQLLRSGSLAEAQVTKVKKDRRGNYVWSLNFAAADGSRIEGKRVSFLPPEDQPPPSRKVEPGSSDTVAPATVVYAPTNSSCWDLSMRHGENAINFKQRQFYITMSIGFGLFFTAIFALGLGIGMTRLTRTLPYRDEIEKARIRE